MKALTPLLLALLAAAPLAAAPVPKISTLTGKTYHQCEIVNVHPDGVSFTHQNGAAKVLFTDLSGEWRKRLGYDPAKAEAYEREQARRREQQAETRRIHEQQRSEALLLAQQMELARLRGNEVQARAALQAAARAPWPVSTVPVLPALGAVYDSREYRGAGYRDGSFGYFPSGFGYGYGYGFGGYGYGLHPGYRCAPFHGGHHHFGGGIRGRAGGVTFSIGR